MLAEDEVRAARERFWTVVRLAIGFAQMAGAVTAFVLLYETGVSEASLAAVVATSVATTISVMLFGRRRRLRG